MSRPLRVIPEEDKNWTDSYDQAIAVVEITIPTVLGMFLTTGSPTGSPRHFILMTTRCFLVLKAL
jgi:hypothetical protein